MTESNIVPFKKRTYPKKKGLKIVLDDFELFVTEVRKGKLKAFVALTWLEDDVYPYESFGDPIDMHTVLGAMETYKVQIIRKALQIEENE
jgi:hypothetical protein